MTQTTLPRHLASFRALFFATLLALGGLTASGSAHGADQAIPRPPELERDVQFWIRVYTQATTNEGFVHDQVNLGVVYEKVSFATGASSTQRRAQLDAVRDKYSAILKKLGDATIDALSADALSLDERRVRDAWGAEGNPARYRQAVDDIRFQLGQSDRFRAGLIRSAAWEGHIADTVSKIGLPPEIASLPHVESSFDPTAYSKVGAAGLWQFMRSTGRRFLRIDDAVDERFDPYRASEAAAQLLDYNYRLLGSWPLALTAYNHGAGGMRRARDTMGTTDIVRIVRGYKSPSFGFASRNFYVSFLAALDISHNPEKYFGQLQRVAPQKFHEIALPAYVPANSLVRVLKVDREKLEELNPALRSTVWKGRRLVPRGYHLRLPAESSGWTAELLTQRLSATEQYAGQPKPRSYRVRSGDTLASVAARNMISDVELARLNKLKTTAKLTVGRSLLLPEGSAQLAVAATRAATPTSVTKPAPAPAAMPEKPEAPKSYVVRRGDALSDIARRVKIPEARLVALNQIRNRDSLYEGQRLRLSADEQPTPDATVAAVSSGPPAAAEAATNALLAERRAEVLVATAPARVTARSAEAVSTSQAEAQGPALLPGDNVPIQSDVIDYSIAEDGTLRVVAAETLGHYADWLGVSAQQLRMLNKLQFRTPVLMGRKIKLDFSKVKAEDFERIRREYHQKLQAAFFVNHRISGTETYAARRGDSLWAVTQRHANLPVWLLQQYNPDFDFSDLRPGAKITVPTVEEVPDV
ncbi:MAG: LysM peptidoglycan-binding domain-containing protein [Steroidobacteraceae bacterium]